MASKLLFRINEDKLTNEIHTKQNYRKAANSYQTLERFEYSQISWETAKKEAFLPAPCWVLADGAVRLASAEQSIMKMTDCKS